MPSAGLSKGGRFPAETEHRPENRIGLDARERYHLGGINVTLAASTRYNARMCSLPRRRPFVFRLRTLLILVTVAAVALAWYSTRVRWIHARRAFLKETEAALIWSHPSHAPSTLRVFGEDGYWGIRLPDQASPDAAERARGLFPESDIVFRGVTWDHVTRRDNAPER